MKKRRKIARTTLITLVLVCLLPFGVLVYAMNQIITPSPGSQSQNQPADNAAVAQADTGIASYDAFLQAFGVQSVYKKEIDRLVADGNSLSDVLVAYDFLYQNYGAESDLEPIVSKRTSGQAWEQIFTDYDGTHKAFQPRSFDPDQLEKLTSASDISSDDIMIADRVSFQTGEPFDQIIKKRISSGEWGGVFVEYKILHNGGQLPRVQITADQLRKYVQPGTFSEAQVTQAFVIARKTDQQPEQVIDLMQKGASEEAILAQGLEQKYKL